MSAASPTRQDVEEYVRDFYGSCVHDPSKCKCLRGPWLGIGCPDWRPAAGDELNEIVRAWRVA